MKQLVNRPDLEYATKLATDGQRKLYESRSLFPKTKLRPVTLPCGHIQIHATNRWAFSLKPLPPSFCATRIFVWLIRNIFFLKET